MLFWVHSAPVLVPAPSLASAEAETSRARSLGRGDADSGSVSAKPGWRRWRPLAAVVVHRHWLLGFPA